METWLRFDLFWRGTRAGYDMTDPIDELVRACPDTPAEDHDPIDIRRLMDYRAGTLSPEASAEIERRLVHEPDARRLVIAANQPPTEAQLAWIDAQFPRASRRWPRVALPLAMAAAALVAVIGLAERDRGDPLPSYRLDGPRGAWARARGPGADTAPGALPEFLPDGRLEILLRPEADRVGSPPVLGVFLAHDGGPWQPTTVPQIERGTSGGFRVGARVKDLFGSKRGRWTVRLVLASDAETLAAFRPRRGSPDSQAAHGVRTYTTSLIYRADPETHDRPPPDR